MFVFVLSHDPKKKPTFFEKLKVTKIFLYNANAKIDNIAIFPNIEAIINLFRGLIRNKRISKMEIIVQIHTFFVPFE